MRTFRVDLHCIPTEHITEFGKNSTFNFAKLPQINETFAVLHMYSQKLTFARNVNLQIFFKTYEIIQILQNF